MHIVWHVVQGDVKNLRYSLCNLRTPAIFSQGAIVSDGDKILLFFVRYNYYAF